MDQYYRYEALSDENRDIRIFELLPGTYDDDFRGNLTAHALQDGLQYEGLSYTWGDPAVATTITFKEGQKLEIAENLQRALRKLRHAERPRLLWVDAICIDQTNLEERNCQVSLMQKIYRFAETVLAWVDHDLDPQHPSWKALGDLLEDRSENLDSFEEDADMWEPVVELLENPYWNRAWVQQELVTGTKVHIVGPRTIVPLEALAVLQLEIQRRSLSSDSSLLKGKWYSLFGRMGIGQCPAKAVAEWRTRFTFQNSNNPHSVEPPIGPNYMFPARVEANTRGTLLHSLNAFRFLDATDPRDRVYSLLSTVRDCTPASIPASYGESLASCFAGVAKFVTEKYGVLEFLCHVHLPLERKEEPENLPSWIPDWHSQDNHPEIFSEQNRASGDLKALPSPISVCKQKLRVQGFCLDTLKHVDTVKDLFDAETNGFVGHLLELSSMINARKQDGPEDELVLQGVRIPDQLLCTICHKFEGLVYSLTDVEHMRHGMLVLYKLAVLLGNNNLGHFKVCLLRELEIFKALEQPEKIFIFQVQWAMAGKCFVVTEKGYAGLILASPTQAEDEVWILFGCSMPVVLRREDNHYVFVTPVSINGIMKGEAVEGIPHDVKDGDQFGNSKVQTIELR